MKPRLRMHLIGASFLKATCPKTQGSYVEKYYYFHTVITFFRKIFLKLHLIRNQHYMLP